MPIHVVCPGCGRGINAADKYAGTSAKCPGCGAAIDVPPLAFAGPPPSPADVFDADEILAESQAANRMAQAGPTVVEDIAVAAQLRTLNSQLRDAHDQLAEVIKHTKRTGQWVAFWSILALLPFFFWVLAFIAVAARR